MFKKKDIYQIVKNNTEMLYKKYSLDDYINDKKYCKEMKDIILERLYELNLNICNQAIYDYSYVFTNEDLEFIEKFNLYQEIKEIIVMTLNDLKKSSNN